MADYPMDCGAGEDMKVDGKVGIGTTTPGAKLEVIASSGHCLKAKGNGTNWAGLFYDSDSSQEILIANGTYAATFTGGNVGIETESPGEKLQVNGNIKVDDGTGDPGTNRVWTTQKVFNIKDYGASPSASASTNRAAIQAAINDAATYSDPTNMGAVVFIPNGVYTIDDGLTVDRVFYMGISIIGEGGRSSILKIENASAKTMLKFNYCNRGTGTGGRHGTGIFTNGSKQITSVGNLSPADIPAGGVISIVSNTDKGNDERWAAIATYDSGTATINLFYPYEGSNSPGGSAEDFFIKYFANSKLLLKGLGFAMGTTSNPDESHIAVDLGDEGGAVIEDVLVYGSVARIFKYGIWGKRHVNTFRDCSINNCGVGLYLKTDSGDQEVNQQRIVGCSVNECKNDGVLVRGYNCDIIQSLFHGSQSTTNTDAVHYETAKNSGQQNGHRPGDVRGGVIIGCYFERWVTHINMEAIGNCIISNFHSGTATDGMSENYYSFGANVKETTAKIGNSFQNLQTGTTNLNYGEFSKNTNTNLTGDIQLAANTSNRVGIGSPNPASKLHIYDSSDTANVLNIDCQGSSTSQQSILNLLTKGDGTKGIGVAGTKGWCFFARGDNYSSAAEKNDLGISFADGTTYTNALWLENGGNIGVGTTGPTTKLHVGGPIRVAGYASGSRPTASTVGAGTMIWNTSTNIPNFSDGSYWRDAAGNIV